MRHYMQELMQQLKAGKPRAVAAALGEALYGVSEYVLANGEKAQGDAIAAWVSKAGQRSRAVQVWQERMAEDRYLALQERMGAAGAIRVWHLVQRWRARMHTSPDRKIAVLKTSGRNPRSRLASSTKLNKHRYDVQCHVPFQHRGRQQNSARQRELPIASRRL